MRARRPVPPVLLLATRNQSKLAELRALAGHGGLEVLSLADARVPYDPAEAHLEPHDTFAANALAKARYYHRASGGLPTVADDSGLEVRALKGAPGVRSRRWAGATGDDAAVDAANNEALLRALDGVTDRAALFVTVVAYVQAGSERTFSGAVSGRIATAPRGSHGFGYDPLFEVEELGWRTFAELTASSKHHVSHRGRALRALVAALTAAG